jgi:hypothetical protein
VWPLLLLLLVPLVTSSFDPHPFPPASLTHLPTATIQ